MPLATGTQFGRYQILGPLGAGGMGEVYRARDTRLGREVALKVLPADVAGDPSRLQRFELEARSVAALNHPNIVGLYDVGDGYFVTEMVDGEPLRGGTSVAQALDTTIQIADGVAAAHRAGIVHRDLKPTNVLRRRDGQIKILDFGLAKVAARSVGASTTQTMQTQPGTVVGTAGYMSPEQVRGDEIDGRSDIFNIGLILFELLAGKVPFRGDSAVEIMAAILKEPVPDLPASVPANLRRVVARCLDKNPDDRFQSAADLAFALRECRPGSTEQSTSPGARPSRLSRFWVAFLLLAAATVGAGAVYLFRFGAGPESWLQTRVGGPELAWRPRLASDGKTLAMLTMVGSQSQLAVMRPDTGDWSVLTRPDAAGGVMAMSWSPDNSRIYFDRHKGMPVGIYSVPVIGGAPRLVLDNAGHPEALPDGSVLGARFNSSGQYQVIRLWPETGKVQEYSFATIWENGQPMRAFPSGQEAAVIGTPLPLPSGQTGNRLYVLNLESGRSRLVHPNPVDGGTVTVDRDGRNILFADFRSGVLRVPAAGRSPARTLLPVTGRIFTIETTPAGEVLTDQIDRIPELALVKDGHSTRVMSSPGLRTNLQFTVLRDGRSVWLQAIAGRTRLVTVRPGGEPEPLLVSQEPAGNPVVELAGGELAFLVGEPGKRQIGIASLSTGRIVRRLPFDKGEITSMSTPSDGRTLYCVANHTVWAVPATAGADEPVRRITDGDGVAADPDGRYLAVVLQAEPTARLYRVPLDGSPRQEVRLQGDWIPTRQLGPLALRRDGGLLNGLWHAMSWFYDPGIIDMSTGRVTMVPHDARGDYYSVNWTPDGQIMSIVSPLRASIWKFSPERQ